MSERDDIDRLEARLRRAHLERGDGTRELDAAWRADVMRAVRAVRAAPVPGVGGDGALERLVLRGLVTSAAAAVLAALLVLVGGRDPATALERLFAADPGSVLDLVLVLG